MEIHGYTQTGQIDATIDGQRMTVPDNMGNRHRKLIMDWEEEGNEIPAYQPPTITNINVNTERDRRIQDNFMFNGVKFDFDSNSKANISGAAQLAFMSVVSGAQAGDLRWHGGDYDFVWLSKDNTPVPMDAQTVINFGKAAANHESTHVFAARALKNMETIPQDYTDDKYWP